MSFQGYTLRLLAQRRLVGSYSYRKTKYAGSGGCSCTCGPVFSHMKMTGVFVFSLVRQGPRMSLESKGLDRW